MRAVGWLLVAVLLVGPLASAAPARTDLRLQAPLDLSGEVALASREGILDLPLRGTVPAAASRVTVTLLREGPQPDRDPTPATPGDAPPDLGLLPQVPAPGLGQAPEPARTFEMLAAEGFTITARQSLARTLLAVGPFDEGALHLAGARASLREAPARHLAPYPVDFVRSPDATWLLAGMAGTARAEGSVRGVFQGVHLLLHNGTTSLQFDTTYRHDGVRWTAVVRWTDAAIEATSKEPFALLAPSLRLRLDGLASAPAAWGSLAVDDEPQAAEGRAVQVQGLLEGVLRPGGGSVAMRSQGDVAYVALGGQRQDYARAAAMGAGAALLGAIAWRFVGVPLYARIAPQELLDNEVRRRVHGHVAQHPGADIKDTAAAAQVSWSTAAYHLARLEREGVLTSRRSGRSKRFFVNGGQDTAKAEAIGALRNPTALAIADLVAKHPGMMQKELGAALGLPASTVSWHMRRLRDLGVVREDRRWRRAEYAPGPLWRELRAAITAEGLSPSNAAMPPASPAPAPARGSAEGLPGAAL
jgi:DNA-binding transcriptional ArsR family regulator